MLGALLIEAIENLQVVLIAQLADFASLDRRDYEDALLQLDAFVAGLERVPVFRSFFNLMREGVENLRDLESQPGRIPAGAKEFKGHHYAYIALPMTWQEARRFCEVHGGHLASASSQQEQDWISRTFGAPSR